MLTAVFLIVGTLLSPIHQDSQQKPPRLLDLLDQSGIDYEKVGTRWRVQYQGKNDKEILVIVAQVDDTIVMAAFPALAKDLRNIDDLNKELMALNIDYDYIKIGTDEDGDYQVRHDVQATGLEPKRLSEYLSNVASVSDGLRPIFNKYKR